VTTAQRARLVVAMGLLNLILATVALTAGVVIPSHPQRDVAAIVGTPSPSVLAVGPSPTGSPVPTGTPLASPEPTSPSGPSVEPTTGPSVEPSIGPSDGPSIAPTASPTGSGGPIVGVNQTPSPAVRQTPSPTAASTPTPTAASTPTPTAVSTPTPTSAPTARPTAHPTPPPTPAPTQVGVVLKPRPLCPSDADGPPGHHKVAPAPTRPCAPATKSHGSGGNGMVVVLPLALGGLAAATRTRLVLGARRLVRAGRSTRARRRVGRAPRRG
jgi:hypothetical protein